MERNTDARVLDCLPGTYDLRDVPSGHLRVDRKHLPIFDRGLRADVDRSVPRSHCRCAHASLKVLEHICRWDALAFCKHHR